MQTALTFFPAEESKQRRPCKIIDLHFVSPRQTAAQNHLLNYISGPHGILHKKAHALFAGLAVRFADKL
jgi:hypothetical protein